MKIHRRYNFFSFHLVLSLFVGLVIILIVFLVWYPTPLATATGVTHLFLMMLAIDIVIGPILGLIVYKDNLKVFRRDLSFICILQVIAMGYGVYTIAQGRPAWLVYSIDRFELVRNNELIYKDFDNIQEEYKSPSWFGPKIVGSQLSNNLNTRSNEMFEDILGGVSLAQKPKYYTDFKEVNTELQKNIQDAKLLVQFNNANLVQQTLKRYPDADSFVPLKANELDMTVLLHKQTGKVIAIVNLRPW
ncbi:TfpX/TfpZ family type IV pilin accessory protein [Acinetobacter variabilis]|uniref:TfpX/TfpZ family type IV pilin accessory protein n=1 Tax=Acinetobacter variabilis TaxID=70346 RepID=UPI0028D1FBC5|nr:TfpX/TfpZ family type IV pilin accessory protein [Acinetobacter lwoffii]